MFNMKFFKTSLKKRDTKTIRVIDISVFTVNKPASVYRIYWWNEIPKLIWQFLLCLPCCWSGNDCCCDFETPQNLVLVNMFILIFDNVKLWVIRTWAKFLGIIGLLLPKNGMQKKWFFRKKAQVVVGVFDFFCVLLSFCERS